MNNIEDMYFDGLKIKKHAKRMGQIADDWDEHWDEVFDAHIESFATIPSICWNCKIFLTASYIRCLCCARTFCPHCDIQFHSWNVFHQHVAVPCFIPSLCQSCRSINTLTLEPLKNKYMIVVTLLGRFDLNAASFTCHNPACGATNEASVRNYVNAGYWPGSPTRTCTLFTQTYMVHWFHTKHQIPSTAAMKYIEVSGKMSSEGGRNPVINPVMFRTASSQFSYIQHKIDVDVKLNEFMRCKACVLPCKYCHFDVIFKLLKQLAGNIPLKKIAKDSVIVSDAKIQSYVEKINKLKPQKGYDNCGNSTYKAGKENTSRHRTQDETGLGSACYRHGVVLVTANLKSEENYRVVNFSQHFLWTLGYVYFCYDVICNYGKFFKDLVKVSEGHKMHDEWMRMTCASLGEEQEQKRYEKNAKKTYLESLADIHSRLQDDIGIHTAIVDSWQDSSLHQVRTGRFI
ncbi:hypothetical protein GHT06_020158 [Daphnia sinensis]|uniref:CxC3 like cysteine cluster domain-containing protein n=1 Tax=Daphnia sinensis TaxID=1820382 RepID=A0AAD5PP89_9CRUS|nr:hypothetical protein GHT06_020158 [Daphnia sinensis]